VFVLASPIVDWNAISKICVVALAAGAGTVVIFGFLLLGLKIADSAGTGSSEPVRPPDPLDLVSHRPRPAREPSDGPG
jgi:hypothetical protein